MHNLDFYATGPGRIACGTAGAGLAVLGMMALIGPGPYETGLIPLATCALVVGGIFATVLAIDSYPLYTVRLFHRLAVAGFVFLLGAQRMAVAGRIAGVVLLVVAVVPLAFAIGAPLWPRGEASRRHTADAHG